MQRFYRKRRTPRDWLLVALAFFGLYGCTPTGSLEYEKESAGAFKGRLQLKGLQTNHDYVLSLNGYPGRPGNDMLPQLYGSEGYVDFTSVTSSNKGEIQTEINVPLPSGKYTVKFLVKDPEANWRIAWQKEFLTFSIN